MVETIGRGRRLAITAGVTAAFLASGLLGVTAAPARADGAPAAPRAVIIVGPTEGQTNGYVEDAQAIASDAAGHGMDVVRLYSTSNTVAKPNGTTILAATWQNVVTYVNGYGGQPATIVVYMGHGNGYPNPYPPGYLMADRDDGFVLDYTSHTPCAAGGAKNYCGEGPIGTYLHPNPNAVVLLEHLCYASGDSEWDTGTPTVSVADQRADNYGAGFLKAGAAAVFAYGVQDLSSVIDAIFTTHETLDDVFMTTGYHPGSDIRFGSSRVVGADVHMNPFAGGAPDGDPYYRSVVGRLTVTTDEVLGGSAPAPDPDRWSGSDRYGTAAAIDDESFPAGPTTRVFVADGAAFPDALAGAAAAAKLHAPLVLTAPDSLPAATVSELNRLKPAHITILGGLGSVSAAVATQLGTYVAHPATDVDRVAGTDRYGTAQAIAAAYFGTSVPVVYIADGLNFPDALAGAAAAGHVGAPILLVDPNSLPDATAAALTALAPHAIKVLGGTSSVSAAVVTAIAHLTGVTPIRLAGSDRYGTAIAISQDAFPGSPSVNVLYIASGANFPDALAGASLGGPMLLVPGKTVPASVLTEVARLAPHRLVFLGGPGSVSYSVMVLVRAAAPGAS